MNYTLTDEQQAISDFVLIMLMSPNISSMAIKAFAGCGKSFILKHIANFYKDKRFLGLAFGNKIAAENSAAFPKRNSKWFTVHVFARTYLQKFGVNFDFANQRSSYKALELIEILNIKDSGDYILAESISEVFKVYSQSSLVEITPEGIRKAGKSQRNEKIISINDAYLDAACKYAVRLWEKFEKGEIAPTFDFYLKYFEVKRFAEKITDFDILELDEAQDSNAVTMSIVTQLPTKNIYVGDAHQSIFGFRGTINAMNYADKVFYLSTTFRYIPKIAAYANAILSTYKNEKVPIVSLAKEKASVDGITAYLSRNNSSMISLIDDLMKKNIAFKTAKDPKELFEAAIALLEYRIEKKVTNQNFQYLKRFQDFEQAEEYIEETNDNELKTALKMQKMYGKRLYILLKVAKEHYRSKDAAKIVLSTAHSSKGLEWDKVELLNDFPDIVKLIKDAKIKNSVELMNRANKNDLVASNIVQEINLFYVAVTRARFSIDIGKEAAA
ncbi:MAG: helicase [Campylobacterota bacterium]|nr:helicase [Campylobacterota bacterium]